LNQIAPRVGAARSRTFTLGGESVIPVRRAAGGLVPRRLHEAGTAEATEYRVDGSSGCRQGSVLAKQVDEFAYSERADLEPQDD
jgi:hypothetical protein